MLPKNQPLHFELFRYQLLPLTQNVQIDLFPDERVMSINSVEELKAQKNEIFHHVLTKSLSLQHRQSELNKKVIMESPPWFVMGINTKKSLKREKPDFDQEQIETWPHVIVIINNEPDVQIIAVSRNTRAFRSGSVITKILQENLGIVLQKYQLTIQIDSFFEKSEFWKLVGEYQGQITSVHFELISPNMANISGALKLNLDLAKLNADTNSHRTDLKLNSSKGGALEINQENLLVNSLVDYSSEGGGNIKLKLKGIKRMIRTPKSVREISINELSVQNISPEQLERLFEKIK